MIHCCTAAIVYFRSERNIELKKNIDIIERVNYLIQKIPVEHNVLEEIISMKTFTLKYVIANYVCVGDYIATLRSQESKTMII